MRCVPRRSRHRSAFALEKLRDGMGAGLGGGNTEGGEVLWDRSSGIRFPFRPCPVTHGDELRWWRCHSPSDTFRWWK